MLVSIVIRTLNEERYLEELLGAISAQKSDTFDIEVVIVDSGSTDKTLEIAKANKCRLTFIKKEDFSFGRSLNIGCEFSNGEILVFVSGHCIPTGECWLHNLCLPIYDDLISYSYGRQLGRGTTKYSERQVFSKYFPKHSVIPQDSFFCNNANAALLKSRWNEFKFDEEITGLEDMYLAKQLVDEKYKVGYVSDAVVYHIHDETWPQVKHRYEREAIALQKVNPEIHITIFDFFRFYLSSVLLDVGVAVSEKVFFKEIVGILVFRFCQFWGGYRGNHTHRKLSAVNKKKYFYPTEKI